MEDLFAPQAIAVIVQVEHIDGVKNIDSIVKVPGIDCVFIGPNDLSGSLNVIGQTEHPEVLKAINFVKQSCMNAGIPLGIYVSGMPRLKEVLREGFSFIALSADASVLGNAARKSVNEFRESIS